MTFDFDRLPDLGAGDSLKWNRYAGREVLPLWVADMDFAAPPAVVAALQARVARASFGYAEAPARLVATLRDYLQREYDWLIEPEWLVWLPGLVSGLNLACRAVDGDVFSATPVYPPFLVHHGWRGANWRRCRWCGRMPAGAGIFRQSRLRWRRILPPGCFCSAIRTIRSAVPGMRRSCGRSPRSPNGMISSSAPMKFIAI